MTTEHICHILSIIYVVGFIPMAYLWAWEQQQPDPLRDDRPEIKPSVVAVGSEICIYLFGWPLLVPLGIIWSLYARKFSMGKR